MSCYIRVIPNHLPEAWDITDQTARRLGITYPAGGPGTFFQANPGESIWDALRRMTPWWEPDNICPFHKTNLEPGEYYPRVHRPMLNSRPDIGWSPSGSLEPDYVATAAGQLSTLTQSLQQICQTIHPCEATFPTYGHDIRNVLILACTEVEMHWRGVLVANGWNRKSYSTADYVRLVRPLRLNEYGISFPAYPWLKPIAPFGGWGMAKSATQPLGWYDAYNGVKHNREREFSRASLEHAFSALSACVVMMIAQFGFFAQNAMSPETRSFFRLAGVPPWDLTELYVPRFGEQNDEWTPVNLPLDQANT